MWKRRGDLVEGRRVPVENFQAWASDLLEEAMANRASGLVSPFFFSEGRKNLFARMYKKYLEPACVTELAVAHACACAVPLRT